MWLAIANDQTEDSPRSSRGDVRGRPSLPRRRGRGGGAPDRPAPRPADGATRCPTRAIPRPRPDRPLLRARLRRAHRRGCSATRAGLERADFERRYADLEDCFCAVFERELDLLLVEFAAALDDAGGWRQRLRAVAYAFHRWLAADPRSHPPDGHRDPRRRRTRARLIQWRGIQQMIDLLDEGRTAAPRPRPHHQGHRRGARRRHPHPDLRRRRPRARCAPRQSSSPS